jgi:hypothetical protein
MMRKFTLFEVFLKHFSKYIGGIDMINKKSENIHFHDGVDLP